MYKTDKKIITNNNLDKPDKDVLEKAKSIMPQKRVCWKINAKQITALAASCFVIIIIIVCIPFMLPANDGAQNIPNSELSIKFIESIDDFNKANDLNILCFGTGEQIMLYEYNDTGVFVEEKCVVNGISLTLLVKLNGSFNDLIFEKETKYIEQLDDASEHIVSGTLVYVSKTSQAVILSFTKDFYRYYMSLSNGEHDDAWLTILENFLNQQKKTD